MSLFSGAVLSVISSFTIISLETRELVALLTVSVLCFTVSWVCLQSVIKAFSVSLSWIESRRTVAQW